MIETAGVIPAPVHTSTTGARKRDNTTGHDENVRRLKRPKRWGETIHVREGRAYHTPALGQIQIIPCKGRIRNPGCMSMEATS